MTSQCISESIENVSSKSADDVLEEPATMSANPVSTSSDYNFNPQATKFKKSKNRTLRKINRKVSVFGMDMRISLKNVRYLQKTIDEIKQQSLSSLLCDIEYFNYDDTFQQILKNMTKKEHSLLQMKLNSSNKGKKIFFSFKEKMEALVVYKKNPICYRLLSKYLPVPPLKTINRLLSEIKISSGINPIIFKKLKGKLHFEDKSDRVCSLIFGEMLLTPHITYDQYDDRLHGFVTNDNLSIAKRAIVFMVKGAGDDLKFEQPLAYYFINDMTKTDLKLLIRTVVEHAVDIGLIIVSIICNNSPLNVTVVTELVNETKSKYLRRGMEWRYEMIRMKRQIMIPLFNTVNLLMGIRNHLLTNDLVYTVDNKEKIIKWKYFQMLNDVQGPNENLRLLRSLTDEHVNPEKLNKKDPRLALQLFSQNVAASTYWFVTGGDLPQECNDLVDLTLLLNQLFDTFIGDTTEIAPDNNKYKGPVTLRSPHYKFWEKAITILKTVKFLKHNKVGDKIYLTETSVPSVTNLIKTIEGMEAICRLLYGKYGFNVLLTINFSYNPLQKLFDNIRCNAIGNKAPNAMEFERGFKALLIKTSKNDNQWMNHYEESDHNVVYFQTLNFFLTKTADIPTVDEEKDNNFDSVELNRRNGMTGAQSIIICRWILKKYLKHVAKDCLSCRKTLLEIRINKNISSSEKDKSKRCDYHPSKHIVNMFTDIEDQATVLLRGIVPKIKLRNKIKEIIEFSMDNLVLCLTHKGKFVKYFKNVALNIIIFRWCTSINRILVGKKAYVGENVTRVAALNFFKGYKIRI